MGRMSGMSGPVGSVRGMADDVELEAHIRGPEGDRVTLARGPDYEAAKAEIERGILDGEQLLYMRRL